jgi:hypothetical protein
MRILLSAFAFLIFVGTVTSTAQTQQCTSQTCRCNEQSCPWLKADLLKADGTAAFCGGHMFAIVDLGGLTSIGFDVTDDSPEAINRKLLYPFVTVNKCPCPEGVDFHDVLFVQGLSGCTSVAGVQLGTVQALLNFTAEFGTAKDHASANIVISGGSENGHSNDPATILTHGNGHKLDVVAGTNGNYSVDPITQFVFDHFTSDRTRADGCTAYGDSSGPELALENALCDPDKPSIRGEHWDLAFPFVSASTLTIQFLGSGGGGVTSEFLDCIGNCSLSATRFIHVNLSAIPDANSVFSRWDGVDSTRDTINGAAVFVFVDSDRTVAPVFFSNTAPPGNSGCWTPTSLGFLWTCPSKPPQNGGTPPPSGTGCWHWDPSAGSRGGWIFDVCGGTNRGSASSVTVTGTTSHDPNEKLGTQGVGAGQYLQRNQALRYAIFFSNLETATAPAQEITVTDHLDFAHDELASFSLGPVAFGNILVSPPAGASTFSRIVDLRPGNNLLVKVEASLDSSTGLLTWHFTSLDPATGQPPLDPSSGFLPPGGEGSVFFTVLPKAGTPTNTQINNQATIVFDANAPIPTQTWLNTIDNDKPVSHVLALPAQSSTSIPLQWVGTDVGAGVQDFTIFVSDNGSPFTPFLTNVPSTSTTFPGQPGHLYGFFSTARDFVGNVEDLKTTAEVTTTVVTDAIPPTTVATLTPPPNINGWNNSNVSITLKSTDNPGGSGVQQIILSATGGQPIPSTNVAGNSAIATISNEGVSNLSFFAIDFAENVEPAHTLPIRIDKTPPSINGTRTPSANANGWNNTNVAVSFTCGDALSGLAPGSPPTATVFSSEGTNQQVNGACFDLAGNTASATLSGINIDKTPPVLSGLPVAGCTLWPPNHKFVTVATISAADVLSGLASFNVTATSNEPSDDVNEPDIVITGTGLQPQTVQLRASRRGPGTGRIYTINTTATDAAGNVVSATSTCTVPHDRGH